MELPESRQLKNAADQSVLRAGYDPRKLVAFHTAVMLVLSLAAMVIDFALEQKIGNTGGLSGVGMRAVLETVQTVLRQVQSIALPFWQVGWIYAAVKIAQGETAGKKDLPEGFRRFPGFLRLTVLKGLILLGIVIAAAYVSSSVLMMTPLANAMRELMTVDPESLTEAQQLMEQMMQILKPLMIVTAIVTLVLYVPFFYRFRMAEYCLLDEPQSGARAALRGSRELMRGNMWKLMRLDLSFWWFWLLTVLVSALGWADMLLPVAGIALPWSNTVSYFAAYLLAAAAQLALYYFCKARVDVTYAHAYLALQTDEK